MLRPRIPVAVLVAALALAALAAPPAAAPAEAAVYSFGIHFGHPYYAPRHYGYHPRGYFSSSYHRPYPRWGAYGSWGPPVVVGGPRMGAVDVDVKPNRTEVYVDGSYVGRVGELDGFPSYLWLEVGDHELAFYQEGFETAVRTLTVRPGLVIELDFRLREGVAQRPDAPARSAAAPPPAAPAPAPRSEAAEPLLDVRGEPARLELLLRPTDASVYLDGRFLGTAGDLQRLHAGLVVEPGSHVLELVRPGYLPQSVDMVLDPGEELQVELELEPGS